MGTRSRTDELIGNLAALSVGEAPPEDLAARLADVIDDLETDGKVLDQIQSLLPARDPGVLTERLALHPNLPNKALFHLSFYAPLAVAQNPGLPLLMLREGVEVTIRRLNLSASVAFVAREEAVRDPSVRAGIAREVMKHPFFSREHFTPMELAALDDALTGTESP